MILYPSKHDSKFSFGILAFNALSALPRTILFVQPKQTIEIYFVFARLFRRANEALLFYSIIGPRVKLRSYVFNRSIELSKKDLVTPSLHNFV
jgi:hypothetical protein